MMQSTETTRMVELLTTATRLPEPMQALALGYAKGLADAEKLRTQPTDLKKRMKGGEEDGGKQKSLRSCGRGEQGL